MIILLKEFLSKNKADTFISFIKNQMISLYNELTTCENINNSLFLQIVNKNDIFVKVNNNYVIQGTITVLLETKIIHNGMSVAHLEDFVVKKKFRTLGIGKELINHSIRFAKDNNCYKIILNCSDDLKEYYKKRGFDCKNNEMSLYLIDKN